MTTNSVAGKPGFSSKADADGPTAGFDTVIGKTKRKRYMYGGHGSRRNWLSKKDGE